MVSKNILFLFIILSGGLQAQMFSVGGDTGPQARASDSYFRIGYSPIDFSYEGKSTAVGPEDRLDFSSPAVSFGIETQGLNASLSFVNKLTGAEDERYLNLSLDYINRFMLLKSRAFQVGIPLGLNTSLVSVQNEQISDNFSQTVFGFGLGLFTSIQIPEKISVSFEGVPSYGVSNSSGGLFGGSNKSILAKGRLNFLNIFPGRSLSLGYDFKYSSYDLDDDEFDYGLTYHLITLGISL
ncbi:MAG: DUF3996 domain-containing protein [Balneola sp.]